MGGVLMLQGTGSHVGKSVLVAALCRIFHQDGINVAPFKAQNMSLNSGVTADGNEIGRAQLLQAQAAGIDATAAMNPILLKPQGHRESQVIVEGQVWQTVSAVDYHSKKRELWPVVCRNLDQLRSAYEVVMIEGAGSPAEVNLRASDIVNMEVALYAEAPVLIAGDIDRGGIFAWLLGTLELLSPEEKSLVKALIVNKFRGDISLLQPGIDWLEERCGLPVAGIIPYVRDIGLAEEDTLGIPGDGGQTRSSADARGYEGETVEVAVIRLPRISNFTDFDILESDPAFSLRWVAPGEKLAGPDGGLPHLVILPGTKTTLKDLDELLASGMAEEIRLAAAAGVTVMGICGGYQMMGRTISDPCRVESESGVTREGLGLIDIDTVFEASKELSLRRGSLRQQTAGTTDIRVEGYEIHMGRSTRGSASLPLFMMDGGEPEGSVSQCGKAFGTYLHGVFDSPGFRETLLKMLLGAVPAGGMVRDSYYQQQDAALDGLAAIVREHLDMGLIYELAGVSRG